MQIEVFRAEKGTSQLQSSEGWTPGHPSVWKLVMRGILATNLELFVKHVNKY